MKKALAIALAVVFVLAFAVPAFAQGMTHTVKEEYVDAVIDIERQAGHLCNTGAELKYTVKGSASEFMAERSIAQVKGKITVSKDEAGWIAGATPLTVTSVIELCMPAKHEYALTDHVYANANSTDNTTANNALGWQQVSAGSGVVSPAAGYQIYNWSDKYEYDGSVYSSIANMVIEEAFDGDVVAYLNATPGAREVALRNLTENDFYRYHNLTALTDQIWAVQVQSDAGFSGNLKQGWEAAYGDYEGWKTDGPFLGNTPWQSGRFLASDELGTHKTGFGFRLDENYYTVAKIGSDYVGNYFNIEQHARVSQGTLKRYIDVSSPWSGAFVSEDTTVTGKADVQETFAMINLTAGADIATEWWELF